MGNQEQPESKTSTAGATQDALADELHELGNNIKNFLRALWESQERKRAQQEIEAGLTNLGASISQAASEFQQSPSGQRVKEELDDLSSRIRSGEMESAIRRDFLKALETVNSELSKALENLAARDKKEPGAKETKE